MKKKQVPKQNIRITDKWITVNRTFIYKRENGKNDVVTRTTNIPNTKENIRNIGKIIKKK